jgi:hypothetical protein
VKNPKHSGWTEHPDGSHTAKIGRTKITIYPAQPWMFWRGDHKGLPCQTGPGERRTVGFHGSHSGGAFTVDGAKALALWTVLNDLTGKTPPDSIFPPEELEARRVWEETVDYVNRTYGNK